MKCIKNSKESQIGELERANETLRLQLILDLGKEAVENDKQVVKFVLLQYVLSFIISVSFTFLCCNIN